MHRVVQKITRVGLTEYTGNVCPRIISRYMCTKDDTKQILSSIPPNVV